MSHQMKSGESGMQRAKKEIAKKDAQIAKQDIAKEIAGIAKRCEMQRERCSHHRSRLGMRELSVSSTRTLMTWNSEIGLRRRKTTSPKQRWSRKHRESLMKMDPLMKSLKKRNFRSSLKSWKTRKQSKPGSLRGKTLSRPWRNQIKLLEFSCSKRRMKMMAMTQMTSNAPSQMRSPSHHLNHQICQMKKTSSCSP